MPEVTVESHPFFDASAERIADESRPAWDRNYPCPLDLRPVQKELDRLTGRTATGQARLKVVWGMSPDDVMWVEGRWMRQHPHWRGENYRERFNPATGLVEVRREFYEIGVPRFYVMELHERSELLADDNWQQARYEWRDGVLVDVLGPLPADGFYTDLFTVAYHDHLCCDGREHVQGVPCLGLYRPPGEPDYERIRRILRRRDQATPDELNPSPEMVGKRARELAAAREERFRTEIRERVRNSLEPHAHTFITTDESVIRNGQYHWTNGHSKSGLKKKDREKIHKGKPA